MRSAVARSIPPQNPPSHTTTSRLDIAAFLLARDFKIARVEMEGITARFVFADPNRTGEAVQQEFYNGALVPANAYADAAKRIRDLLWEAKRRSS